MKKIIVLTGLMFLPAIGVFAQIEGRVVGAKGSGVQKVTVTAIGRRHLVVRGRFAHSQSA